MTAPTRELLFLWEALYVLDSIKVGVLRTRQAQALVLEGGTLSCLGSKGIATR